MSYQNAGPSADAGPDLVFNAANLTRAADGSVSDPDLAVNALIAGFESHTVAWTRGATNLVTSEDLVLGILASGLTSTTDTAILGFAATDLAGATDSDSLTVSYANALPTIGTASATPQGNDLLFQPLHPASVANAGFSQGHENMQPFLTINFCIALQGIFPSPN